MIKGHLGLFFKLSAGTKQDSPCVGTLDAQHCSALSWFPESIPTDNVSEDGTCSSVSFSGLFQVRFQSLFLLLE